ncbi:AhpC/TSA antioxidant enzyme [Aureococcus anophagefferens]|nr:AhpC/TSA antioxidant enzyme [Aureococcus anophagefferens]
MGLDLKADMHVRERRTGGRGMVLRFWRHHNGHVWAEVRFINGDTLTVRSTNLERVSLSDDEVEALSKFEALPADPLELLQRTIDRSVRVTADDGVELTNEFDEVLQADGTALTADDLSVNRRGDGRVVPEGGIDEEAALEASTRARAGRATTRTRQLVCARDDDRRAVVTCDICVRRARGAAPSPPRVDAGALRRARPPLRPRLLDARGDDGQGAARDARGSALAARGPGQAASGAGAAPEKRPRASLAKKDDGPRLQIFDVNTGRYVDVKKDAGRGIRYHRLRHRLRASSAPARAAPRRRRVGPEPAPKSTADKCFELAALLLEGGFVGKLPVARAADREAAMENDVFTGRHRTRTTPDAVLDAGWTRHWDVVTDVAGAFAKAFGAATDGFVDDGVCEALLKEARRLPDWAFERVVGTLRDTPAGWADAVREVLLDEYHQPFDDAVVYHPAHKLVLISMVAKGLHDVNVLKLPPPATYAARPDFRVLAPGDDDARGDGRGPTSSAMLRALSLLMLRAVSLLGVAHALAPAPYETLRAARVVDPVSGATTSVLEPGHGPTLVAVVPQLGEFDSCEFCEFLAAAHGDLAAAGRRADAAVEAAGFITIGPGVGPVKLGPFAYENSWKDEAGYQRPVELATVRLRHMVEVLGNWDAYYEHRGVLTYSATMARPLSFLAPYIGAKALNPLGLGDNGLAKAPH